MNGTAMHAPQNTSLKQASAFLDLLPEPAAFLRYTTGEEATGDAAEVAVSSKLSGLVEGIQPSQAVGLEAFLQAAFGSASSQAKECFNEARKGKGQTWRRRIKVEYSEAVKGMLSRWWDMSIEALDGGQTWIMRDATQCVGLEERLSIVSNCSPSVYFFCEHDTVRECGDSAASLLGLSSSASLIGQDLSSFAPPEQPDGSSSHESWEHARQQAQRHGRHRCQWVARTASGAPMVVEMHLEAVTLLGVSMLAVFWNDVTKTAQREEQLIEAVTRAEKLSQAKSLFLANMSHEIRTPMNGVIGVAELLLQTEVTDEQRSYLEIIQSSGDNLLRIISDVLDLSKIESQSLELEAVEFNVHKQVSDAHALLTVVAEERDLKLTMDISPQVPVMVIGDPVRIRQVLLNLMSNAIKFTPSQGSVSVSLRLATEEEIAQVEELRTEEIIPAPKSTRSPFSKSPSESGRSTSTSEHTSTDVGIIGRTPSDNGRLSSENGQSTSKQKISEGGEGEDDGRMQSRNGQSASQHADSLSKSEIDQRGQASCPENATRSSGQSGETTKDASVYAASQEHFKEKTTNDTSGSEKQSNENSTGGSRAMLRFEVRDTGVGIPDAAQSKLFQPFTQADATTARKFGGTGLGLAICRLLVQLMGGTIGLTSKVGEGSSFFFYANLGVAEWRPTVKSEDRKPLLRTRSEDLQAAMRGIQVLVAEDNKVNQLVAMRMLKNLGIQCDIVDNGQQAVENAASKHYDLILMDCHMPEVDGFEATRIIRQSEAKYAAGAVSVATPSSGSSQMATPCSPGTLTASHTTGRNGRHQQKGESAGFATRTVIVALTASALSNDREKCLAAGMDSFLSKPIRPADIQQVIATHLSHLVSRTPSPSRTGKGNRMPSAHLPRTTSGASNLSKATSCGNEQCGGGTPLPQDVLPSNTAMEENLLIANNEEAQRLNHGGNDGNSHQIFELPHASLGPSAGVLPLSSVVDDGAEALRRSGVRAGEGIGRESREARECQGPSLSSLNDAESLSRTAALAAAASSVEVAWGTGNRPPRRRSGRRDSSASMECIPFDPNSEGSL